MKPDLDAIEARCNAATSFLARLDMEFSFSKDIPALLAYCRELEAALKAVEPNLDAIVCYASTMTEHDGNRIAKQVRDLLEPKP